MALSIARIDTRQPRARDQIAELRARLAPDGNVVSERGRQKTIEAFGAPLTPVQVVERICADVRARGLAAVLEYAAKLDHALLGPEELRVPAAELAAAHAAADPDLLAAVRRIRARIETFQRAVLHRDVTVALPGGGSLGQRYLPLQRVGVCVPGGAAAYPSTVLMTVVPAQVAGVAEIAVAAPPTPFGSYNRDLLAVCRELGVDEVYRMGGAQGVAALAFGAGPAVRRVDKIVGPGNLFVALAKRHVYGEVDIDSIAGPSEVIVLADATCRPDFAAADLIAQAEHAPGSSVLITWHEPLLDGVAEQLERQLAELDRSVLARESLEAFGALILVRDRDEAAALADELATEHLHIQCERPRDMLARIRCAGAAFLGPYSPVPAGDYAAGPSHVLPTGATARWASGLSANDFLRSNSILELSAADLSSLADDVDILARKEGLTGHAASVLRRTAGPPQSE
jgi:histidinol dehydrogenase